MTDRQRLANPVGWFEIYVAEMDRAKDFYEEVVGAGFSAAPARSGAADASFLLTQRPQGAIRKESRPVSEVSPHEHASRNVP